LPLLAHPLWDATEENGCVLDPWNGAGTTTQVSFDAGWRTIGIDINPLMKVIARARLLRRQQIGGMRQAIKGIVSLAKSYRAQTQNEDALGAWYQNNSVSAIRSLTRSIQEWFEIGMIPTSQELTDERVCFSYIALFAALNALSENTRCSNPTWRKPSKDGRSKIRLTKAGLIEAFENNASLFLKAYAEEKTITGFQSPEKVTLIDGNASNLSVLTGSQDLVITSPPYCTRIDYAITTAIENAVLFNRPANEARRARDQFTGTSTIRKDQPTPTISWGAEAISLCENIRAHGSYAAASYYYKTYVQYFDDLSVAIAEVKRTLKIAGRAIFVVQDSYFKELHVDLAKICTEMFLLQGMPLTDRADFRVENDLSLINTKSKKYRTTKVHTETVLCFIKA
jgi:hypothetical protein